MADIGSILREAAEQAFGQLGFMSPQGEGRAGEQVFLRGMMVRFGGPAEGALVLKGDAGLLATLAMNMLGAETKPPLPLQLDALGEIANVICGNVLPVAEDPAAEFRLAPPTAARVALTPGDRVRGKVRLQLDAGVAEVTLLESVS